MSFDADLARAKKEVEARLTKIRTASAINLFNNIIVQSPVDTGHFRHNWQATITTPALNTLTGTSPDANVTVSLNGNTLQQSLYLTNNLPYAQRLEDGWSQQRGAGWVRASVMSAQVALDTAVNKVGD